MPNGKPNILFIMADDIGWFNASCYHQGVMGYETPNIDRIAREGVRFTDFYGQQSCTAGRAAFITGQSPIRTGLTKVGDGGGTAHEEIVVHRVPLDRVAATIAEHRAKGHAIDAKLIALLGGNLLEDAAQ